MVALQVWDAVLAHLPSRVAALAELETSAEVSHSPYRHAVMLKYQSLLTST